MVEKQEEVVVLIGGGVIDKLSGVETSNGFRTCSFLGAHDDTSFAGGHTVHIIQCQHGSVAVAAVGGDGGGDAGIIGDEAVEVVVGVRGQIGCGVPYIISAAIDAMLETGLFGCLTISCKEGADGTVGQVVHAGEHRHERAVADIACWRSPSTGSLGVSIGCQVGIGGQMGHSLHRHCLLL